MKTATKWILGILIGLIILAILVTLGYLAFSRWKGVSWVIDARGVRPWDGEGVRPWRELPREKFWQDMPRMPHRVVPIMPFSGFFPLRLIGGWLICPGLLALLLGVVALVLVLRRPRQPLVTPVTEQGPDPAPALSCPNCERAVQDDWIHCPYCGVVVSQS